MYFPRNITYNSETQQYESTQINFTHLDKYMISNIINGYIISSDVYPLVYDNYPSLTIKSNTGQFHFINKCSWMKICM